MRKIYFLLFTLFSFLAFKQNTSAQLANTYIYISSTGATLDPMTGATTIVTAGVDDAPSAIQNIGFTFNYEGVPYTQFSASPDGFIKLGAPAAVAQFGNAITSTTNIPKLFPFWDDLATGTGGSVSFVVTGSAPNRILVVQWFVTVPRNTVGAANSTMQAWLYETSGTIEFRYGAGVGPSSSASIGINGAVATNFISITTPGNASSTTTANNSNTAWPGSGTMYTFFPPPPCVPGSLAGGTTQGPVGISCPGVSFTLSVTGASFGTGLTYQWESSPDGSTWTNVGGATGQTLTTSVTVNTYFRRKMTCSGTDAWSTSLLVTVSAPVPLPVNEGFNTSGTTVFPGCWSQQFVVGTGAITFQTSSSNPTTTPFEGTRYVYWNSFSIGSGNETRLISPAVVTTGTASVDVQFYWFNENSPFYTTLLEGVQVQYSLDGTTWVDAGSFIPRQDVSLASGTGQWKLKKITLPAAAGNQASILVGFKFHSVFGDNCSLDAVTIQATPPCVDPSGLTVTASTPTTATLSWTASPSNPTNGYQWEVRTSGAAGSGAAGLAASGVTAAGVTTANATGLTANTTYSYYVRSDCGGVFSAWTAGFGFTTPCNAIGTPFTETFSTYATTFPPTCWTRNNTTYLFGNAASANGVGAGSSQFDFYDASSGSFDLVSPLFTAVPTGYRLTFDEAYATFAGEDDQLQIFYSTNGGASYTSLILYDGGTGGPLNTGGASFAPFTPAASQWQNMAVDLPIGTNRLLFRGISAFGNNLFLDNITVEQTPSCLPVSNVTAVAVSPTTVIVNFTPPATTPTVGYIVEYGPPGFTPGTTNTPGAGGTVVLGAGSPITVGSLTPSTAYDFYVRKICIAGVDFSTNKKVTATTLCNATNIPYLQDFESSVVPAPPTCTSVEDLNGNNGPIPNSGGGSWFTYDGGTNTQTYVSPTKTIRYLYDAGNSSRPADDYFYLQGLNLTGGTAYRLKFFFKGSDGPTWTERLEVRYGTQAYSGSMTNLIYTNNSINTALANPFDSAIVDFTPATTGVYYIGFHAISLADQAFLYLDNVSVKLAPLVDVGITGVTIPSINCPTTSPVFIQATIKNYNTTTVDFGLHNVNITSSITGPLTGSPSALLNSGTLAPGASMSVYLSPAFNFSSGGLYNINVATHTVVPSDDPETGNDAYSTTVNVNPNPPTPVITPSSAQICIGNPVQLSTQFAPSPPPVTLPVFSSGTISIPVPDASAAGASHSLAVSGVPAGATVTAMSVTLNMTHTWVGDMIFNLKAPNGNILNLDKYIGGTDVSGFNFVNTVISSAGVNALTSAAAPRTGIFKPDAINTTIAFTGVQNPAGYVSNATGFADLYSVPNGTWTLAMADGVPGDVGTLTSWSITITYQILTPVITWTPVSGLYTNAGATTAYPGGNAYSLYANPAATSTYTVTATTAAGCTASATATVTVNPYPVITVGSIPDTVCTSDPLIPLVASPVGGAWSGVGVSGTNFVPPATAVGTYTLSYSYTSVAGCTSTSTKKIAVKDCPERIILLRDNALFLYPNPNNGQFNIQIHSVLYSYLTMKVYSNDGALITTKQFGGLAWGRVIPVDLSYLPGGVYMVKFYYDGGVRTSEKTFKVIVSR
ncbi:MAG: choice-of-anchor J domain-containing protein [Bacteroidota bacterium]|nr:choice-of-anchor J domain-containing protein [Bacteroidota bacterium]